MQIWNCHNIKYRMSRPFLQTQTKSTCILMAKFFWGKGVKLQIIKKFVTSGRNSSFNNEHRDFTASDKNQNVL